jgi:hypothetical protein
MLLHAFILSGLGLMKSTFGQVSANVFGSSPSGCTAPTMTDCIALYERLSATDTLNPTYNILHSTFTPISSYANCAISAYWDQNIGEGYLVQTYNSTGQVLLQLLTYGFIDNVGSGVLARTDFSGGPAPLYWALTAAYPDADSWQAGFSNCRAAAQNNLKTPPTTNPTADQLPSDGAIPDSEVAAFDQASGVQAPVSKRRLSAVERRASPSSTCREVENTGNSRKWDCICNGRVFTVYCDYVERGSSGVWSESDRTAALLALNRQVRQQLDSNTIEPGDAYRSNPVGAFLLTGASGSTGRWHVPSPKDTQCCPFLLERQCGPTRIGNFVAADFSLSTVTNYVSNYGQCEPSNRGFAFISSEAAWTDWGNVPKHTEL